MGSSVYIASVEGSTGKSTVALGVLQQLSRRVERVAVFRPIVVIRQLDCVVGRQQIQDVVPATVRRRVRAGVADLTLLGNPVVISAKAAALGAGLPAARFIDPERDQLGERLAAELHRLRQHRGVDLGLRVLVAQVQPDRRPYR
jgi:hypothetical protein